jgi:hypothetical protein
MWIASTDLSTGNVTWTQVQNNAVGGPGARCNHAGIVLDDGSTLVIAGGIDADGVVTDTVFLWSLSVSWRQLSAVLPIARHSFPAWPLSATSLLVWGGENGVGESGPFLGDLVLIDVAADNITTLQFSTANKTVDQPSPRAFAAPTFTQQKQPRFFGGFSGYGGGLDDRLFNETWNLLSM